MRRAVACGPWRRDGLRLPYESLERHARHAPCAHAGAGQAGGGAGASRAPAPARGAAPDRARLGDAARCPLPTARERSSSCSTCTATRRSSSTATGAARRVPLTPDRPVGEVTRELLGAVGGSAGPVEIDLTPQETPWTMPLDEDDEHATYDPAQVDDLLRRRHPRRARARRASARPTAAARRPSTPGGGRSTSRSASSRAGRREPPSDDFIMRNSMDAEEVAVGWWPGDARYPQRRLLRLRPSGAGGVPSATLSPAAARWDEALGEYVLDWDDAAIAAPTHTRRARVRPLGVPARLHGLRLGPRTGRQRRGQATAGGVAQGRVGRTCPRSKDEHGPLGLDATPVRPDQRR